MAYRRRKSQGVLIPAKRRKTLGTRKYVPIPKPRFRYRPFGERKWVDLATTTYGLNTTGTVTLIPVIPQGSDVNERIGRKVTLKSIAMRGYAVSNANTLVTYGRVMLVYDRQPNKALASMTDILDSASSLSFNNNQNRDRFLTIMNKSFTLCGNNTTAGQQTETSMICMDYFRKVNLPMQFGSAGTGLIADITTGALLLVTVGATAAGTSDGDLTVSFRITYADPQ